MNFDYEFLIKLDLDNQGPMILVGSDEVGRGPLAGKVVGCSVLANVGKDNWKELVDGFKKMGITDSKKISTKKRNIILQELQIKIPDLEASKVYSINDAIKFCLWEIGPQEIDKINILRAAMKCLTLSYKELIKTEKNSKVVWLVDGNQAPDKSIDCFPITKGDQKSVFIGLSSIIAKEYRDYYMRQMDQKYPGHGFSKNAGYPTKQHRESILRLGITPIHRKSFSGVK